ncbi:hypothetical protein SCYAM73S_07501 [Streptomyces cyaneofuscatus]
MTVRELDAAGIHDPALRAAYAHCRGLNARHGKTYFLATRLLPVDRRPAVHAVSASPAGPTTSWTISTPRPPPSSVAAPCSPWRRSWREGWRQGCGGRGHRAGDPRARRHRSVVRHRPRPLHRLPGLHAQRSDGRRVRLVRGARPVHARLRRRDRPPDASGARDGDAARGGRSARGRARGRLPADELPAGRGRGPGPGPALSAGRTADRARGGPGALRVEPEDGGAGRADHRRPAGRRRPQPGRVPGRPARDRDAHPGVAALHPYGVRAVQRHPGLDRGRRVRGAAPPVGRPAPPAGGGGAGRAGRGRPRGEAPW